MPKFLTIVIFAVFLPFWRPRSKLFWQFSADFENLAFFACSRTPCSHILDRLGGVREAGGSALHHGFPPAWIAREGAPALSGAGRPTVCALRRGRYYLGLAVAVRPPKCLQPQALPRSLNRAAALARACRCSCFDVSPVAKYPRCATSVTLWQRSYLANLLESSAVLELTP